MNRLVKILVVDDEEALRASIRAFMESFGFQVFEAGDGVSALRVCAQEFPDLVLLDINMPGMNGFETCRAIKANPALVDTPVIYLSGLVDTRDLLEAFASGGVDYVSKPFRTEEVRARVITHLELQRQRRELEANRQSLQEALAEVSREQRQLIELNERLRQSESSKSHFIGHMRSEINDPLSAILGFADEIEDPRLPAERARDLAQRIKAEAFHLDFQLRNVFCAAELEAGETSLFVTQVDVESVVRDTAASFAGVLHEKEQSLEVKVAEGTCPVLTDAAKLRIILANLLANAIEFSPKGGQIELRAFQQEGALNIQVEDHGVGLSQENVTVIFERFRQLSEGRQGREHKGQGLGLSVVKALLELLDGQILVDSEPGHGSTFTCRLPLSPQATNPDTFAFDGNLFIFDEPHES